MFGPYLSADFTCADTQAEAIGPSILTNAHLKMTRRGWGRARYNGTGSRFTGWL